MSRRRIDCPSCRAQLVVPPAAEERGRMRCPECEEVIELPEQESIRERLSRMDSERRSRRDDDDDRPRRRRKKSSSGSKIWLWLALGGGLALFICCGGPIGLIWMLGRSEAEQSPVPLMQARAGFQTNIIKPQKIADGPPTTPPQGSNFRLVRYPSPVGNLAAYLSVDPGDGRKHPAIVWAHGGFGGIDQGTWEEGSPERIFAEAGLVVLAPSWRGEADNPGQYEMFYGEVNDAVAAVDYVSKLPYVDPKRVYMAGHSTGGTITLLTVEATDKLRAAFPFGGAPDMGSVVGLTGIGYGNTPFNFKDKKERRLRSAIDYIHLVRTPTFYFEGADDPGYIKDAKKMAKWAKKAGAPVSAFFIDGGDHFDIVEPICKAIARKIATDTGATCSISFNQAEAQKAFETEIDE